MALSDTQSQGFRSNVGNDFGSTESKMLLLLPHCLTSWVAASPGQRGGAKHCVIRRVRIRAGLGGGQEERARGSGRKKSGLQSHCRLSIVLLPKCQLPSTPHPDTSLLLSHCCREPHRARGLLPPCRVGHGSQYQVQSHGFVCPHMPFCAQAAAREEESQHQLFPGFALCLSSLPALPGRRRGRQPGTQAMSRGGGGGGGCSGKGCWLVLWVLVVID